MVKGTGVGYTKPSTLLRLRGWSLADRRWNVGPRKGWFRGLTMVETNRAGQEPRTERDVPFAKKSAASASEEGGEVVLVASNSSDRSCYHTRECRSVTRADGMRAVSREFVERRGLPECRRCAGDSPSRSAQDHSLHQALKAAGERDDEERELVADGGRDGDTRVWVKSNRGGSSASVYHTDESCQSVERAATIFETTLGELLERRPHLTECKRCSGEMGDRGESPGRSLFEAAKAFDPEDDERELVTDGGRDVETPRLPDPQTLEGVAGALDDAADAIDALHLGDVSEDRAHKLRQLRENLRTHRDGLEEIAAESEGSR